MWSTDRTVMRQVFYTAWQHFQNQQPLLGVEPLIIEALMAHPEYHALLAQSHPAEDASGDTNPFLHLGLHIALAEQISTNRPPGVTEQWVRIQRLTGDSHQARHLMMACLEEILWEANQQGQMPDENSYLTRLATLPKKNIDNHRTQA